MSCRTLSRLHDDETTSGPPSAMGRPLDGLEALDVCHRQMLFSLGRLSALIARLATFGPDAEHIGRCTGCGAATSRMIDCAVAGCPDRVVRCEACEGSTACGHHPQLVAG